jgi:FdhD protein
MLSCRLVGVNESVRSVEVTRVEGAVRQDVLDRVAVERALEVRLNGESFSVIMRTPGDDRNLVAGFLFTEGVIRSSADVSAIDVDRAASDVIDVRLSAARTPVLADLLGNRRNVAMNSSCGMCGRRTLESLDVPGDPLPLTWTMAADVVARLPATLAPAQQAFAETGGLHAAGIVSIDGRLERSAEDVGRHNAIDKLIGWMLMSGRLPLSDHALVVSGRLSFEIVQKAFLAGLPMVVAVSAPSSLAIDLASEAGMTLVGFTRAGRFNIYSGPGRVGDEPSPVNDATS